MNHALPSASFAIAPVRPRARSRAPEEALVQHEDAARIRRVRSLIGLFALYTAALLVVITVSDGADIGCILGGIAGHVLYAIRRLIASWRDAAWLDDARASAARRLHLRQAR